MGITIFPDVPAAVRAGFEIESPVPDSEGFLHARVRTPAGWAKALVRTHTRYQSPARPLTASGR